MDNGARVDAGGRLQRRARPRCSTTRCGTACRCRTRSGRSSTHGPTQALAPDSIDVAPPRRAGDGRCRRPRPRPRRRRHRFRIPVPMRAGSTSRSRSDADRRAAMRPFQPPGARGAPRRRRRLRHVDARASGRPRSKRWMRSRWWRDLERENARRHGDRAHRRRTSARARANGRSPSCSASRTPTLFDGRIGFVELFADTRRSRRAAHLQQPERSRRQLLRGRGFRPLAVRPGGRARDEPRPASWSTCRMSANAPRSTPSSIPRSRSRSPTPIRHSLFPHKRNKTDDVIRALKDNGGVIGCAAYRNITGDEYCATVDKWCEMVARTVEHRRHRSCRHRHRPQPRPRQADYDWMRKGRWTRGVDYGAGSAARPGKVPPADWLTELSACSALPRRAGARRIQRRKKSTRSPMELAAGLWRGVSAEDSEPNQRRTAKDERS